MAKKRKDKTALKRQLWIERTAQILGIAEADAQILLMTPRHQSIRLNSLRGDARLTARRLHDEGILGESFAWMPQGYHLRVDIEKVRDHPMVSEGAVFIQNAASWLPVVALDPKPGETILDMCAAPGGKTSHMAAATDNRAHIWTNDNSRPRQAKMLHNFTRLGVVPKGNTLYDARALARHYGSLMFDKILLDAPCSGEGLMRLDRDKDFATWSVAHIKRLQQLQKQLIMQAWQLLRPGGRLIYSTCTMAPEENEAIVDYLLRKHSDDAVIVPFAIALDNRRPTVRVWQGKTYNEAIQGSLRLAPSDAVEAFYVCILEKRIGIS